MSLLSIKATSRVRTVYTLFPSITEYSVAEFCKGLQYRDFTSTILVRLIRGGDCPG